MLIDLEEPFRSNWRYAYLGFSTENRRMVYLFNSENDRTTISFARYLMTCKLGFFIPEGYEVDHINDDKTDDRIENLQVLTKEDNTFKQHYNYVMFEQLNYIVTCNCCDIAFVITDREMKMKVAKNLQYMFCSRSCAGKFHAHKGYSVEFINSYPS